MIRILFVILGSILIAAAYLLVSPGLLVGGICVLLPSLLWLALRRRGLPVAILLAIILVIGLGGALALGSESPDSPLVLGLPRRAALLVYGIGLLPGIIFGILFALGFDQLVISSERLAELRDRLKER
jgi:hypothetical protein